MSRRGAKPDEADEREVRMNGGTEDVVAGAPVVAADKGRERTQAVDPTTTPTPTGSVSSPSVEPETVVTAPTASTSTQSATSPAPVETPSPLPLSPQPSTSQPETAATVTASSDSTTAPTSAPIATPTGDQQEHQPQQQPQPQPPRAFPPAGTLVVVQGVVHTTDVAPTHINNHPNVDTNTNTDTNDSTNTNSTTRPSPHRRSSSVPSRSSSIPGAGPSNRSRTRLSSLMPRPMRSRPSSFAASGSNANVNGSSTSVLDRPATADSSSRRTASHLNEPSATSEEPESSSANPATAPSAATAAQTMVHEPPRPAALSPTSIDVLGTLIGYVHTSNYHFLLGYMLNGFWFVVRSASPQQPPRPLSSPAPQTLSSPPASPSRAP